MARRKVVIRPFVDYFSYLEVRRNPFHNNQVVRRVALRGMDTNEVQALWVKLEELYGEMFQVETVQSKTELVEIK